MTTSPADAAGLFAALGDEQRLRMVGLLAAEGPRTLSQLAQGSAISRQGITKHLRTLERAGLVSSRRDGRELHFAIERARLAAAERFLETVSGQWADALQRLAGHLSD